MANSSLGTEQVQDVADAGLAVHRQAPQHRAPDSDRRRAQGQGDQDVGPPSDAAVYQDPDAPLSGS